MLKLAIAHPYNILLMDNYSNPLFLFKKGLWGGFNPVRSPAKFLLKTIDNCRIIFYAVENAIVGEGAPIYIEAIAPPKNRVAARMQPNRKLTKETRFLNPARSTLDINGTRNRVFARMQPNRKLTKETRFLTGAKKDTTFGE